MMELVSRVKAVLRRSSRNEKKDEIVVGQLKIYPNKHKVKSCGNEVTLTNKEFKLLCLLVESKGNVLSCLQISGDMILMVRQELSMFIFVH